MMYKHIHIACLLFVTTIAVTGKGFAQSCSVEKTCSQMSSCAEATYYFRVCGHAQRDADHDGIPCEAICGNTMTLFQQRLAASGGAAFVPGTVKAVAQPSGGQEAFSCRVKKSCKQMTSCAEAKYQLTQCGNRRLDGNHDGIPCNALCR